MVNSIIILSNLIIVILKEIFKNHFGVLNLYPRLAQAKEEHEELYVIFGARITDWCCGLLMTSNHFQKFDNLSTSGK
jgi:hypothetical protein